MSAKSLRQCSAHLANFLACPWPLVTLELSSVSKVRLRVESLVRRTQLYGSIQLVASRNVTLGPGRQVKHVWKGSARLPQELFLLVNSHS